MFEHASISGERANTADPVVLSSQYNLKNLFYLGLLVATLLPICVLPALSSLRPDTQSTIFIVALLGFLGGNGHVGLTYFYYAEPEFSAFFRARWQHYFLVPALIILGTAAAYHWGSPSLKAYVLLFYFVWQTYHYQRQNHGILSFVSRSTATGPVLWQEKLAFELSGFAGILSVISLYQLEKNTALSHWGLFLFDVGRNVFLVPIPILLLWSLAKCRLPTRQNFPRIFCTVIGCCFFLPSFLIKDPLIAVGSYALAHGLQYFVFMYFVSRTEKHHERDKRLLSLLIACFGIGLAIFLMSDRRFWGRFGELFFGLYLGTVMVHFWVDAKVWKLSEKFQGSYLRRAFSFLLTAR